MVLQRILYSATVHAPSTYQLRHRAPMAAVLLVALASAARGAAAPLPRALTAEGGSFAAGSGAPVLLVGANIVVKGPPFIPDATGDGACGEFPNCDDMHTCNTTCTTFNKHDAQLLKDQGYNFIRLGTPWAGGQPERGDALDPKFEKTLQAILDVCKDAGIYAVLDLHQDAVASANCGEGMPTWVSKLAVGELIGKPLAPVPAAVHDGHLLPKDWPMLPDGSCGANDTDVSTATVCQPRDAPALTQTVAAHRPGPSTPAPPTTTS